MTNEKLTFSELLEAEAYTNKILHELDGMIRKADNQTKDSLRMGMQNYNKLNVKLQMKIYQIIEDQFPKE